MRLTLAYVSTSTIIMEHHHHHHEAFTSMRGIYVWAIVLNVLFVVIEAAVGFAQNSLGLLSDAGHNLSDVFSLLLALFAFELAKVRHARKYTYGYKKSTVLISLFNAIILLVAAGAIIVESIHKFSSPAFVNGAAISWTAGAGIIVNGISTWLLMRKRKNDLNAEGAFLHMAADTLVSVGVVVSGIAISITGWSIIDPIISLVIVAIILVSTWHLLSQSLCLSLDGIPDNIDVDELVADALSVQGVENIHHLHIWAISTTEVALTAHVVVDKINDMERVKHELRHSFADNGIHHATLEFEHHGELCDCPDDTTAV